MGSEAGKDMGRMFANDAKTLLSNLQLLSATVQLVGFVTSKRVFYKWSLVYSQRKLVVNTGSGPFVAQLCRAVTPLKVPSCDLEKESIKLQQISTLPYSFCI